MPSHKRVKSFFIVEIPSFVLIQLLLYPFNSKNVNAKESPYKYQQTWILQKSYKRGKKRSNSTPCIMKIESSNIML